MDPARCRHQNRHPLRSYGEQKRLRWELLHVDVRGMRTKGWCKVVSGCGKSALPYTGNWHWIRDGEYSQPFHNDEVWSPRWLQETNATCGWEELPKLANSFHWVLLCDNCTIKLGYKW
jgi:hypothetical protein